MPIRKYSDANEIDKGGRPSKYETEEELESKILEYFEREPEFLKDNNGDLILNKGELIIKKHNKPTISGLAYWLGFESRQSMYDYEKRSDKFSYIIKRARLKIAESYEENLQDPSQKPAGSIFVLKNLGEGIGMTDKIETENTQKVVFINEEDADL